MRKEIANSIAVGITLFSSACSSPEANINTEVQKTPTVTTFPTETNTPIPTVERNYIDLDGRCFINPVDGPHGISKIFTELHPATDFPVDKIGYPAIASTPGEIVLAEYTSGYGLFVIVQSETQNDTYIQTRYAHLDQINVEVGDKIEQGDALGIIGSTGNSSGPHLHFEVLETNWPFDWLSFQRFWFMVRETVDAYDKMEEKHGPEIIEYFNPLELIREDC